MRTIPFAALITGTAGGILFFLLHLPLPWLLGSLFGSLVATQFPRLTVVKPEKLAIPARAVLGLAIGSAFSPEILQYLPDYLLSLVLMVPVLISTIFAGHLYFEKAIGFNRHTAFFCSLPGGLIEMSMICQSYGADIRRVTLIQTCRVLLIVYSVPFAIHHWTHADLSGRERMSAPISDFPLEQGLVLMIAAIVGVFAMKLLRLPGATIVGPMFFSAILYSLGWVDVRIPDECMILAQIVLGTNIGCSFINLSRKEFANTLIISLGYFLVLGAITLTSAFLIHLLTGIQLVSTVLAYIPGGQAEMNLIALMVGVTIPYIALHHIVRMVLVMTVAPPLSVWLLGSPDLGKNS